MPSAVEIRPATEEDLPALAATLAAAFDDYPWTRWVVEETDHARRLSALYRTYLQVALRFGRVWMAADASGAAAWTWSGNDAAQAAYMSATGLDELVGELAGERAEAAAHAAPLLAEHALTEPHWYLAAVGVAPPSQRRGLGTKLLEPMLDHCDSEGQPAALETSAPANVALYQRLGFAVLAEVDIPSGPRVWFMRRPPNTARRTGRRAA